MITETEKYVTDMKEMTDLLYSISNANISSVRRHLSEGDMVSTYGRITDDFWVIDDPLIYKNLQGFDGEKLPLESTYRIFPGNSERRRRLFENEGEIISPGGDISFDYRVLSFSKAVENRIGVCIERSILLQLSQQDKTPSFLLTGYCEIGDVQAYHAFNIIFKDGELLLVDVKPRESEDGNYVPYIVPVNTINLSDGSIVLPENLSDGRKYSITHIDYF